MTGPAFATSPIRPHWRLRLGYVVETLRSDYSVHSATLHIERTL